MKRNCGEKVLHGWVFAGWVGGGYSKNNEMEGRQFQLFVYYFQAIADAEREKEVLEIKIEQKILDEEGKKNISLINNAIKKAAEENEANIANFKLLKEAEANEKLFTEQYVKLNLAKSLSENTKLFFSGEGSEMGALFNKILKN